MLNNNLGNIEKIFGEKIQGIEYINRSAVYGICFNDRKIAVIKTPTGYFLPGGGIENEENHKECLKREYMEETGYEIEVSGYIGSASLFHISKSNQYLHGIGYFYFVGLKDKTSCKIEDDHELLWIDKMECIKCLFLEHQAWAVARAMKYNI